MQFQHFFDSAWVSFRKLLQNLADAYLIICAVEWKCWFCAPKKLSANDFLMRIKNRIELLFSHQKRVENFLSHFWSYRESLLYFICLSDAAKGRTLSFMSRKCMKIYDYENKLCRKSQKYLSWEYRDSVTPLVQAYNLCIPVSICHQVRSVLELFRSYHKFSQEKAGYGSIPVVFRQFWIVSEAIWAGAKSSCEREFSYSNWCLARLKNACANVGNKNI